MSKKDEDPPLSNIDPDKLLVALIVFGIVFVVAFGWCANHFAKVHKPVEEEVSLGSCFLVANLPHNIIIGESRAMLIDRIILCESGNDCTAKNPISTAYGICQFIDGTWEYVQEKWDMELDRDDYSDQYYACERLLREESWGHWRSSKGCWDPNNKYKDKKVVIAN